MKNLQFRTHTGELVTGERLQAALNTVADFYESNAKEIYISDPYAAHVTEQTKIEQFTKSMDHARKVRDGEILSFAAWQRVDTELTGECVGFLSKTV